ncbi:MAG: hypothetical protein DRP74_02625 [Candidatus Omnitrophota bacterium]|nr:MAG: hypothetical protein DRP74_02625 [Candidatus Omnitrophota bacterium]
MMEFIPWGGLILFCVTGIAIVKSEFAKRPTFGEAEKRYKKKEVCDEIHKSVDEKLSCIPEIKKTVTQIETKIDLIIKNNGYH